MSKKNWCICRGFAAAAAILQFFTVSAAQNAEISLSADSGKLPRVRVSGRVFNLGSDTKVRNISFPNRIAGLNLPAGRVGGMQLHVAGGARVSHRELIPGEFLSDGVFETFEYEVSLPVPMENRAAAHISWIGPENGILMLSDLLPMLDGRYYPVKLKFSLPDGWEMYSEEKEQGNGEYLIQEIDEAVFLIGTGLRRFGGGQAGKRGRFDITFSGSWLFSENDAATMTSEIASFYSKMLGRTAEPFVVNLMKFPGVAAPGNWEAETRGRTVTIISSDMPFRSQSIQRLHEQLRHELFHLWIPNGLSLEGNYDWFYEGFTLYVSLKTGVMLNQIGFGDFLDTLARAKNIDERQDGRISLIGEADNRWTGAETRIYARGMAVAFLSDVKMLTASGGKRSIEDVYRRLLETYQSPGPEADGNEAILKILRTNAELIPVIEKYITGVEKIVWRTELLAAGIEDAGENSRSRLVVSAKPSGRQKALLDKLGYNNWRKLSRQRK